MTKYICKTCGAEKEAQEAPICEECSTVMEESAEDDDMDDDEDELEG